MRAALAFAAVGVVLTFAGGAGAQSATLFATVGPGFSIRLADASGTTIRSLDPGTYPMQVDDKSSIHNFHLTGPGVDQATDVEQIGTAVWTVTFVAGTYDYVCDAHPTTMKGSFTVGASSAPPPPPPPAPPPVKKPVSLTAVVGPAAKIVVARLGVRLVRIVAGPVVLVVNDRSAKDNFHLVGPGVNRATSRLGKVRVTWRLTLKRGIYRYRSDASPALKGSFRVL
jgi:hypothetical protein